MNGERNNAINLTMVSYNGFYWNSLMERRDLCKVDLVMKKSNKECQPTFPKGELMNDSYIACTAVSRYAYLVYTNNNL